MSKCVNVLYEFNDMTSTIFLSDDYLNDDYKRLSHKLEYLENFDGETDVIRYSRCNNKKLVSYYTIRNGIALCGIMKDGEIEWKYMRGMTNFVIPRFKAFKDNGILFVNEGINRLFYRRPYIRTRNR